MEASAQAPNGFPAWWPSLGIGPEDSVAAGDTARQKVPFCRAFWGLRL